MRLHKQQLSRLVPVCGEMRTEKPSIRRMIQRYNTAGLGLLCEWLRLRSETAGLDEFWYAEPSAVLTYPQPWSVFLWYSVTAEGSSYGYVLVLP